MTRKNKIRIVAPAVVVTQDNAGDIVRQIMAERGLTQEAIGKDSGVAASVISGLRRGLNTSPKPDTVLKLQDYVNRLYPLPTKGGHFPSDAPQDGLQGVMGEILAELKGLRADLAAKATSAKATKKAKPRPKGRPQAAA